jgi:hypothetical protein
MKWRYSGKSNGEVVAYVVFKLYQLCISGAKALEPATGARSKFFPDF